MTSDTPASSAAATASWAKVAREIQAEKAQERRELAEWVTQKAAYLLIVIPALIVLGLVTIVLGLIAVSYVVAILVSLHWSVTAFFCLVLCWVMLCYNTQRHLAKPWPSWPR